MLFGIHSLACSDGNHLVDVVYRTTATEVIYRACDTLEDRTEGFCSAKTLNHLV